MASKRVIPFIYSADIAYVIVLGAYTMTVYYDDSSVDTLTTPYDADDIFELQTAQIGDVMWITHASHAPRKLSRTGASEFSLDKIDFTKGPFLTRNDLVDPDELNPATLTCSVTAAGDYGTLTASTGVFHTDHVGALYQLTHPKDEIQVSTTYNTTSDVLYAKGAVTFTTRGTWTGTVTLQRNENGKGWEDFRIYEGNNDRNVQETFVEDADNVGFRIVPSPMTIGFKGEILSQEQFHSGVVKVMGYASSTLVAIEVLSRIESTDATVRWAEGAWSDFRGWPASVTFFQNRCCFAGALTGSVRTIGAEIEYPTLRGIEA